MKKQLVLRNIGIGLIVLSTVLYLGLFGMPFLHLPFRTKAIITAVLVAGGEITFWVGAVLVGRELAMKYRHYLNPVNWFKKKKAGEVVEEEGEA